MTAVAKVQKRTHKDETNEKTLPPLYRVTSVEKCKLGDDGPAGYRYIIEGGFAPITGFRAGTKDKVFKHATGLAGEMNARRGMKGTKHIVIGKSKA